MAFIEYRRYGPFIHLLIPQLLQKIHIHLSSFLQYLLPFSPLTESEFPTIVIPIGLFPPPFAFPSLLAVRRKDGGGGKASWWLDARQEIFLLPLFSFLFSRLPSYLPYSTFIRRSSPPYLPTYLTLRTRFSRSARYGPHHDYSPLVLSNVGVHCQCTYS